MALPAPRETAAVNGVGPDTGGNHDNNLAIAGDNPAIQSEQEAREAVRRYYFVLANLLVRTDTDADRDAA